jgi:CubicO group peptidase (beta-lactamase class C family)
MMKYLLIFLYLSIIIFNSNSLFSQGLSSEQIDSVVNRSMSVMSQAGVAIAVVQNGKITHSKGYGVTSILTKEKVNEHTLFAIGSNSKAFTAATLAILVDEGKLSWDDKVVDILPEFRMYDPWVTANFNIRDLLCHRSGLGLGAGDLMFFPDGSDFTMEDILKNFQYLKPVSDFRTHYDYDNLLYLVGGEVVARVSGMSWNEFVKERIMKPLGMNRSAGVYQDLDDKSNVAFPHSSHKGELKLLERHLKSPWMSGAGGGIYSSIDDMSKWLLMHLNNCNYGENLSKQLISEENHNELWKPHMNISFSTLPEQHTKTHFTSYGLGVFISDVNGHIIIEHTGRTVGMMSRTFMIPELNVGAVVLTNTDPGGFSYETIRNVLRDAFVGAESKDWISWAEETINNREAEGDSVLESAWAIAKKAKSDHLDLNNYTGEYRDNWFGNVEIKNQKGKLWFISERSPKMTGEMFYYKANTFVIEWDYAEMEGDAFANFILDENGNATSIKMKGISPNIDFSFDFQDLDLQRVESINDE